MQNSLISADEEKYMEAQVKFLVGNMDVLHEQMNTVALTPFSDEVVDFLDCFSKKLMKAKGANRFPDVVTLGFWCRRASVENMKKSTLLEGVRLGRGNVFHIAPSNVAVNFAYSMIASLLAGNTNIVRLPSKEFEQIPIIANALNEAFVEYPKMAPYCILVKYGRDKKINDIFSKLCDVRVIWGGDSTIATLRQSSIGPRTKEICFADRYSICVINSDQYLKDNQYKEVALGFYNDTYLSDQNACTSPKLVVWMGDSAEEAQTMFWDELQKLVDQRYELGAVQVVDKLDAMLTVAAKSNKDVKPRILASHENKINRVKIEKADECMLNVKQNSGLFFEIETNDLKDILPVCNKKLQTISVVSVDRKVIESFIVNERPQGIDRVVSVGKTLDFNLVWDGYDLIHEMSRQVSFV